jgi:hypothetical protein
MAYMSITMLHVAQGNVDSALAWEEREPSTMWRSFALAGVYQAAGRKPQADAALTLLVRKCSVGAAYQVAQAFACRGEANRAFQWLEKAYRQRDGGLSQFNGDPLMASIVKDPRNAAMLRKPKLADWSWEQRRPPASTFRKVPEHVSAVLDRSGPAPASQPLARAQAKPETIEQAIVETEQRIARLGAELQDAHQLLAVQKADLVRGREEEVGARLVPRVAETLVQSTGEKAALFRSLFRGHDGQHSTSPQKPSGGSTRSGSR